MINSFHGEYRWLSNFWHADIRMHVERFNIDVVAPTNEHMYQAMKSAYFHDFMRIIALDKPGKAKRVGKDVTLIDTWENDKLDVMYQVNLAKYLQHNTLRAKLLNTGNRVLIEGNLWNDTYWGMCNGKGENHLGKILMRIRKELA